MPLDPVASLAALPGVGEAAAQARAAVDALLWDRTVRARMGELVMASRWEGAWASAALDGADVRPEAVRDGSALDGSPIGRVLAAAVRLHEEIPRQVEVFERAPAQAWARLHAVAARGFVADDDLGRPRRSDGPDDPLHLAAAPSADEAARRLAALSALLLRRTEAPAVVLAALVHGELLAVRPFQWGSALVARAATRLVLASRGVDPDCVSVPEAGVLAAGRTAYASSLRGYQSGAPAGVADWVQFCCRSIVIGAERTSRAREELPPRGR